MFRRKTSTFTEADEKAASAMNRLADAAERQADVHTPHLDPVRSAALNLAIASYQPNGNQATDDEIIKRAEVFAQFLQFPTTR